MIHLLYGQKNIAELTDGEVVAIDGKCMRGSSDDGSGTYTHLVSAWASANNLLLAQEKVAGKSNEITAIPRLLRILELKNCIVTIDAMGCQREIARTIIEREADYILALKVNPPDGTAVLIIALVIAGILVYVFYRKR